MSSPIGYYVHHQGQGHLDRALLLADALDGRITLLGTGLAGRTRHHACIDLPDDRIHGDFSGLDGNMPGSRALHYAPIGHAGIAARIAKVAAWIAAARPGLFIADVSVEMAMLARLASVPLLYVRLAGRRIDPPHLEAFRGARALLVPYDARLDDPDQSDWVRAKSVYMPGLCERPVRVARKDRQMLVVLGRGSGRPFDVGPLAAMAIALPEWRIRVLGDVAVTDLLPANLVCAGWVDTVAQETGEASLVVGAAGDGLVNLVLASRTPFVCIPEPRAYDEQVMKARALEQEGAAIVCRRWPESGQWPAIVAAALERCTLDHGLDDPNGVARAAAFIAELADNPLSCPREKAA